MRTRAVNMLRETDGTWDNGTQAVNGNKTSGWFAARDGADAGKQICTASRTTVSRRATATASAACRTRTTCCSSRVEPRATRRSRWRRPRGGTRGARAHDRRAQGGARPLSTEHLAPGLHLLRVQQPHPAVNLPCASGSPVPAAAAGARSRQLAVVRLLRHLPAALRHRRLRADDAHDGRGRRHHLPAGVGLARLDARLVPLRDDGEPPGLGAPLLRLRVARVPHVPPAHGAALRADRRTLAPLAAVGQRSQCWQGLCVDEIARLRHRRVAQRAPVRAAISLRGAHAHGGATHVGPPGEGANNAQERRPGAHGLTPKRRERGSGAALALPCGGHGDGSRSRHARLAAAVCRASHNVSCGPPRLLCLERPP
eukprot:404937-Prymnesium_polylepis.1